MTSEPAEGTPATGGDIVGPGTGGSPTGAGSAGGVDRDGAADETEVAALIEELRSDRDDVRRAVEEAAEEAGTGTDR